MKPCTIPKAEFTSTLGTIGVGVSATRPVSVGSWIAGMDGTGDLSPGDKNYPGWHYGSTVYLHEQDKRFHDHAHFEICIIRQGSALHKTESSSEELGPGTVIVMAPGMVHAIYSAQDLHQTNLYYLTEWLADDLISHWRETAFVPLFLAAVLFRRNHVGPIPQFMLNTNELENVDHELANITRESNEEQPSLIFLRSCLLKILITMSRAAVRASSIELSLKFRKEIVALAISPANLAVQFQKSTGWSPMAYYQHRRVQHACRLLLDLDLSITDVAYELGYCDAAHFTHLFKKHQKILPSAYRRLYAKTKK